MNKNKTLQHLLFTLIAVSPMVYLLIIWPTVPKIVPTHFGSKGPNRWDNKSMLWIITGLMAGISLLVYFLMQYINKIDPKRVSKPVPPVFNKMAIGLVIFMTALNYLMLLMSAKGLHLQQAVVPIIGLLFAFIGNMMHNLKPNYFAGIRVAWTLSSDYNWRKTHQFAGKLWFGGGLLITFVSLLTPFKTKMNMLPMQVHSHFLLVVIIPLAILPYIYSFILFKKEQADPSIAKNDDTDKN